LFLYLSQKKAKEKIEIKKEEEQSKIYYVPDERDDVDEEDPDEDLNF